MWNSSGRSPATREKLAPELEAAATGGATVTLAGDRLTGDVIVLAVPYSAAVPVVREYGDQLEALGLLHMALQSSLDTGFRSALKFLS
jgi:predicted dinucleotide-binding enzyme